MGKGIDINNLVYKLVVVFSDASVITYFSDSIVASAFLFDRFEKEIKKFEKTPEKTGRYPISISLEFLPLGIELDRYPTRH